ncbi:molybdate ABC transporter substrate-binding protein [Leeuwenhoekiella sp. H156]|uniref:molybdate ABC transporter substrate-binding protein n=1 Tax=Leeuwenhoekiella sp. H156 TaxID=3450128 RepID=UPI003FA47F03
MKSVPCKCITFPIAAVLAVLLLSACAKKSKDQTLRLATAANMQFAMKALAADFEARTGIVSDLVISSSGKLTAQIKEGAPYDVFVSADMAYPQAVYEAGFAIDKPKIYAFGKLVLWSYKADKTPVLSTLITDSVQHIALANPQTAPYGSAAVSVLKRSGIYEQVEPKLVYGESIAQTNQFITSGAAEMGFTALAVVKSEAQNAQGKYLLLDESLYEPIAQAAVVIKREKGNTEAARAFYTYLFSPEAQKILKDFGYSVDE